MVRNVIADYGSRYIDHSEWDKPPQEDKDGIHELFALPADTTALSKQHVSAEVVSERDIQQMLNARLHHEFRDGF